MCQATKGTAQKSAKDWPDIKDAFAKTGIAHIVAVSGYNISVVTKLFLLLLLFVGLWRRQSFWVTLGALASFTLFTGASASVVRAAFMGGIVLVGEYIGRVFLNIAQKPQYCVKEVYKKQTA